MTDRDYAIKSMKEITFQMASHAQDYLEVTMERHYTDIKELMTSYQKLILENQIVLEELDMECQEKINEDMAYALSYLSIYNNQLNVPKMHREMNNLMIIYGLSDMIYRGMTLVKFYAPNGVMLSEILHSCFCSHYNKTDVEVQQELGIGRTSFYKMKKQALGYLGFYFYEIVVPQAKDKRLAHHHNDAFRSEGQGRDPVSVAVHVIKDAALCYRVGAHQVYVGEKGLSINFLNLFSGQALLIPVHQLRIASASQQLHHAAFPQGHRTSKGDHVVRLQQAGHLRDSIFLSRRIIRLHVIFLQAFHRSLNSLFHHRFTILIHFPSPQLTSSCFRPQIFCIFHSFPVPLPASASIYLLPSLPQDRFSWQKQRKSYFHYTAKFLK